MSKMLPDTETELFYQIALTYVPKVGPKTVRNLLAHLPTAKEIFRASGKELAALGMSETRAKLFKGKAILEQAEEELNFVLKNNIRALFLGCPDYPGRLLDCNDAPVLLYYKGNANLNPAKTLAIIGTRKNTDYGQRLTEELVEGLKDQESLQIISGLALGIDTIAHKASLKQNIATVGILGHGLDRIYPFSNTGLADEMIKNGGLLSEFPSGTLPDKTNFPVRNRIVAGMSDITVVVESNRKGGAMITAYVAASYNREVAAFPGRIYDTRSEGPNHLIRKNIAAIITSAADLIELMNWEESAKKPVQKKLFIVLSEEEQRIMDLLGKKDAVHSDELLFSTGFSSPQLASVLLQMEMQNYIKALPGKFYRAN